jgi:hypothetical protein
VGDERRLRGGIRRRKVARIGGGKGNGKVSGEIKKAPP